MSEKLLGRVANYEDSDQTLHTVSDLSRNCLLRHVPTLRIITYVHVTDFHGGLQSVWMYAQMVWVTMWDYRIYLNIWTSPFYYLASGSWLCWGLTTHQILWVILSPREREKEIEGKMKVRDRDEREIKEREQKKQETYRPRLTHLNEIVTTAMHLLCNFF